MTTRSPVEQHTDERLDMAVRLPLSASTTESAVASQASEIPCLDYFRRLALEQIRRLR